MAYTEPKVDWNEAYDPSPEDMNRIEGNTKQNHEDVITKAGLAENNTFTGDNNFTGNNAINASKITGLSYGDIGTYTIAASTSWSLSTQYLPGTTVDGSTLFRSDATTGTPSSIGASLNQFATNTTSVATGAGVPTPGQSALLGLTGTWTLMTRVYRGASTSETPTGLFLRTA